MPCLIHIKLLLLALLLSLSVLCHAQFQQNSFNLFSVENGLPSDFVYKCWQDNDGFLWISTDAGLARFDGKHFQVFYAQDGLPDNEIESLIQEKNGKIWVRGFNGQLAFYKHLERRFVAVKSNDSLGRIKDILGINMLPTGGIIIQSLTGTYTLIDNKLSSYPLLTSTDSSRLFMLQQDGSELRYRIKKQKGNVSTFIVYRTKNNHIIEQREESTSADSVHFNPYDSSLYLLKDESQSLTRISDFKQTSLSYQREDIVLKHPYYTHNFTDKFINFHYRYTLNEQDIIDIDVYDIHSLQYLFSIHKKGIAWNLLNDKSNNLWVSTHKGLMLFPKVSNIIPCLPNEYQDTTFYSVAQKSNGALLFGNYNGEVIEKENENIRRHKVRATKNNDWQRNIIVSQGKVITFSDGGIYLNYQQEIKLNGETLKTLGVYKLNDSMILFSNSSGLYKLNSITEEIELIDHAIGKITCLTSLDGKIIYCGTEDGVSKYNLSSRHIEKLDFKQPINIKGVVALSKTQDSIIWAGLATNGIAAIKNNQLIAHLTDSVGLKSSNITTIAAGRKGEVWIGSLVGVSKIKYQFVEGSIKANIQNFSLKDGLASTAIHQLLFQNDTMFVATDKGISCIPDSVYIPEIQIKVIRIRINQKDTLLLSDFELSPTQNTISIDFTGVELNGYFDHAQLSQDEGKSWVDLDESNVRIQFKSGEHIIWLRAVDVNNHINSQITKLHFNIDRHLYEKPWFWFIIICILLAIALYINTIIVKRKHQKQIDEFLNQQALDELEIQSLKAQMNPHFVFNCLNSIKGFIYDEDFEMADLYLDKFAQLLRSTLDYSSQPSISLKNELEYIDTYLTLEKLRFSNKFDYFIECEEDLVQTGIAIPAMILQPYVENAIKHGVCNLDDGLGRIQIKVYLAEEKLNIEIEDNGIGRKSAMALRQNQMSTHESKGTILTERRIELYHIKLQITDKHDENGNAIGTNIHLVIPIPLNH